MLCRAEAVYQSMKSVYGPNACHLLQINSVHHTGTNPRPNLPDPWSQFIIPTSEDTLVRDYMYVVLCCLSVYSIVYIYRILID